METAYYIINHSFSTAHWLSLLAVFIAALAVWKVIAKRRWTKAVLISIFITYIFFILLITLIARTPADEPKAKLIPFWSWYEAIVNANKSLFVEIVLNIALFLPAGLMFTLIYPNKTSTAFRPIHVFLIGFIFSAVIETVQLITCRGLFEWDDMLHNGIGCLLGYGMGRVILRVLSYGE
ncbi:MAG: VanZ family protein [Oscillospiraceae bacterium]|nr:VanZ family protein [Oscillospiraceae bacterium]